MYHVTPKLIIVSVVCGFWESSPPSTPDPAIKPLISSKNIKRWRLSITLIKAVNEVGNTPSHHNHNTYPPTPTDAPEKREQGPRKRPSASQRQKIKRRHRLYYKKKLRTTNKQYCKFILIHFICCREKHYQKGYLSFPNPNH